MWPFKKKPKYRFVKSRPGPHADWFYSTEEWKGFPHYWYGYISNSGDFHQDVARNKFRMISELYDTPKTEVIEYSKD